MSVLVSLLNNIRDARQLGPGFPLRHLSRTLGRKYHISVLRGVGKICIRPASSDDRTFIDVFRNRAYDFSKNSQYSQALNTYQRIIKGGQIPIIIDAGANVGAASIWFAKRFPMARIL